MNIKEAKQEVINTVRAYLKKDETGAYEIPPQKQRPVLLMGPPGIGKTAIMEQVARECGISLVSYTITHHTRQSAIGLPYISQKSYGGRDYSVTEYTMSEIVAAVYDQIEASGISEGILFLDEINCVSETLAPTMLQFLQYKMFGNHKVPEGYIIVTAGNPPQYNKSVRDFDIVTLDRVKRIDIEEDYSVWKEYAYKAGIHGAIMAYLEIRKQDFYSVKTQIDGRQFVTARGWEDLSRVMKVYEELQIPVNERLAVQYLQDEEIAGNFATYYELYRKYRDIYRIPEVLEGNFPQDTGAMRNAPFDEKLSMIGLLIDSLNQEFRAYAEDEEVQKEVLAQMKALRTTLKEADARIRGGSAARADAADISGAEGASAGKAAAAEISAPETGLAEGAAAPDARAAETASAADLLAAQRRAFEDRQSGRKKAGMLSREQERIGRRTAARIQELEKKLRLEAVGDARSDFGLVKGWFDESERARRDRAAQANRHLSNSFRFLSSVYGEGQEIVLFLTELAAGYYSLKFVRECGNDEYYRYNKLLLLRDRKASLRDEAAQLLELT